MNKEEKETWNGKQIITFLIFMIFFAPPILYWTIVYWFSIFFHQSIIQILMLYKGL